MAAHLAAPGFLGRGSSHASGGPVRPDGLLGSGVMCLFIFVFCFCFIAFISFVHCCCLLFCFLVYELFDVAHDLHFLWFFLVVYTFCMFFSFFSLSHHFNFFLNAFYFLSDQTDCCSFKVLYKAISAPLKGYIRWHWALWRAMWGYTGSFQGLHTAI